MFFSNIIDSANLKEQLRTLVNHDEVPHAIIFSGKQGSSKRSIALAFIQYLLCENRTPEDSCGRCKACIKMNKYVHPDAHFTFPFCGSDQSSDNFLPAWRSFITEQPYGENNEWLVKLNAKNKQPNIYAKECKAIVHKLSLQTFESDKKIMMIWLPEYLAKEGNRLLKIIEEPTPNTYFIMVTEKLEHILPTILSRCQIFNVTNMEDDLIETYLREQMNVVAGKAQEIAFVADGNMNYALSLIGNSSSVHDDILVWFRICYSNNAEKMVEWVSQFGKQTKADQKNFLEYALNFLREVARIPFVDERYLRIQENERETAKKIAGILTFEKIDDLSKVLSDTLYYIERNANMATLMMQTNISFKNILRKK